MKPSPFYDRIVDVIKELVKFTLLLHGHNEARTDHCSERKQSAEQFPARVNQRAI